MDFFHIMVKKRIISISGIPGAGKTTVAKILAQKLGLNYYYMGGIIRKMAEEKGMTLTEFYESHNNDSSMDEMIDDYQTKLGKKEDNFVIEGRTSFHFIPQSFKIYFDADLKVAAERIFNDTKKRNEKKYNTPEETLQAIKKRMETEKLHYKKFYNFNCHDKKHYDLIINTTNLSVNEVVNKILNTVKK